MFRNTKYHEAYWNSYRLLENQVLRLAHSICFDDTQINVYSSELADIINSACIKIESLAKDIYEEHIWPFQEDSDVIPPTFIGKNFNLEKWTRDKWKFDHNCLVEIDREFSLSKKQIELRTEIFHFYKYGSTILPFGTLSQKDNRGGYWEYSERDLWKSDAHKFQVVSWLDSYQEIKHNYIESIPKHGTVKTAIMALAAFYLLAIYNSSLPSRQFEVNDNGVRTGVDFGSKLFSCGMCNYTIPPCVIDSNRMKREEICDSRKDDEDQQEIFKEQDLLHDIDGLPFLITLTDDVYKNVCNLTAQYCAPRNLECFDISPYHNKQSIDCSDAGAALYIKLRRFIFAPYNKNHVCVSFNVGSERIYDSLGIEGFDYEKSKYKNKTATVLSELKIGDVVNATFVFDEIVSNGKVIKLNDHSIELEIVENGIHRISSQSKENIISIQKVNN